MKEPWAPAAPAPSRDDLEASLGMAVMDLGDMELPEGLSRRHLDNISDDLRWAYVNAVHKAPMPKLGEGGPTAEQIEAEQYRIFLDEYEASAGRYAREKDEPYLRTAYEHFQRKLAEARARVSEKGFADPGKNGNFAESKKGGGYAGTDKEPEAGTHEGHETGDSLGGGERAGDEGAGGVRELRAEIRPGSELGGASQDRQVSGGAPRRENLGTGKDAVGIVGASGGERRTGLGEAVADIARAFGHEVSYEGSFADEHNLGYVEDGVIHINPNLKESEQLAYIIGHELTHTAEGAKAYERLVTFLKGNKTFNRWLEESGYRDLESAVSAYIKDRRDYNRLLTREQRERVGNSIEIDRDGAEREIVADFIGQNVLSDPGLVRRMAARVQGTRSVLRRILDAIDSIITRLGLKGGRSRDLEQAGRMLRQALGEARVLEQADRAVSNSIRSMRHDLREGRMMRDLVENGILTQAQADKLRGDIETLVDYMVDPVRRSIVDMNETHDAEARRFFPYKPNSDKLYVISMDFSTLCSKRILTQYVIESLETRLANSKALELAGEGQERGRLLSAEEQLAVREVLKRYREEQSKISEEMAGKMKHFQLACAMCYVESARLKSPKQKERWLGAERESIIRQYLAEKNEAWRRECKQFSDDWDEAHGYERGIAKKNMPKEDAEARYKAVRAKKMSYEPTEEELATIQRGLAMPRTAFMTAANLADLAEKEPRIFGAYAQFMCRATKSKGLEPDEPYYYGDSTNDFGGRNKVVTDDFIASVNAENGMRFSSWSDWRIIHLLDYITAVCDLSVRKAAMHGYTKFADEVRALGRTGMMFNLSGVLQGKGLKEDGSLDFSPTESVDIEEALKVRDEFPETAGLQCIGISRETILAMLDSDIIDYIIPYHRSGMSVRLRRIAGIEGWTDYEGRQNETKIAGAVNDKGEEKWQEKPSFSEFFVGYDTGMSGIEAMRASARRYLELCRERGLNPKFMEFVDHPDYWKLLIDRKMINQKTGELIRQRPVRPDFDFDVLRELVDKEVANNNESMREDALNYVLEHIDEIPGIIKELTKTAAGGGKKRRNMVMGERVTEAEAAAKKWEGREVSAEDYHIMTTADFKDVSRYEGSTVRETKDSVSRQWKEMKEAGGLEYYRSPSGSEYLVDRESGNVYRYAEHWGRVSSCIWKLDGANVGRQYRSRWGWEEIPAIGVCKLSDMRRDEIHDWQAEAYTSKSARESNRAEILEKLRRMAEASSAEASGGKKLSVSGLAEEERGIVERAKAEEDSRMRESGWEGDRAVVSMSGREGSYRDNGDGVSPGEVTDIELIRQLDGNGRIYDPETGANPDGDLVRVYRTMQVVNGRLYPPMSMISPSGQVSPARLGAWERSFERPEATATKVGRTGVITTKEGKEKRGYNLDKGQGMGTLPQVDYNPYWHGATTVLNDQFSQAHLRTNLVVVETLVPRSVYESVYARDNVPVSDRAKAGGYHAYSAALNEGRHPWHSGTVSGKLHELTGQRRHLVLSRYDKPVRILRHDEVARLIARQLDGTGIGMPYNLVTPQVREHLKRYGVTILDEGSGRYSDKKKGRVEYVTDEMIDRINEESGRQLATDAESKTAAATDIGRRLNTGVRIVGSEAELADIASYRKAGKETRRRMAASKGWYDAETGEVVVLAHNNHDVGDITRTVLHETVAHHGLRKMFGAEFDAMLDNVYGNVEEGMRKQIDTALERMARKAKAEPGTEAYDRLRREATEEYIARLAETTEFETAEREVWYKSVMNAVREAFEKMLSALGLKLERSLTDNELRYLLWRSYNNLKGRGAVGELLDNVKQRELGVGLYDREAEVRFRDEEEDGAALPGAKRRVTTSRTSEGSTEGLESGFAEGATYPESEVSRRFDEQLESQSKNGFKEGDVYQLGKPSEKLVAAGFPADQPMEMSAAHLNVKANDKYHPFAVTALKGLVAALRNPLAVFPHGDPKKVLNAIVELRHGVDNFIIGVHFNREKGGKTIASIRGVFPKYNTEWLKWIETGRAIGLDKARLMPIVEEMREILSDKEKTERYMSNRLTRGDLTDVNLDSVAKIIDNFGKNKGEIVFNEIYNSHGVRFRLEDGVPMGERERSEALGETARTEGARLGAEVTVYHSAEELRETEAFKSASLQERERMERAHAWYDPSTGRVHVNAHRHSGAADVVESVQHEVLVHKDLRESPGEKGCPTSARVFRMHRGASVHGRLSTVWYITEAESLWQRSRLPIMTHRQAGLL